MRILSIFQSFFILSQTKHFCWNKYSSKTAFSRNFHASNRMVYTFTYEVFGKVQGVFFRKYTKQEADKLQIRGFVQNTERNTVIGRAESDNKESLEQFKHFLQYVGSPASKTEKCVITDEKVIDAFTFDDFFIKK